MSRNFHSDLLLWAGCVSGRPLKERFEVAISGGFHSMQVSPLDLARWRRQGLSASELRRHAAGYGIRITVLDPLTKWLDEWIPPSDMDPRLIRFGDFETDVVLGMAEELDVELVVAVEYTGVPLDLAAGVRNFRSLCDRANDCGIRIALEAMPFSGIATLGKAWEIVRRADRSNGGLVIDTWHVSHSPRADEDIELIAKIPASRVFCLQISDSRAIPAGTDLRSEAIEGRLLPGDGTIDLHRILSAIDPASLSEIAIGPEIFSADLSELPPAELGSSLRRSIERFV